jgi:hypothetical protein
MLSLEITQRSGFNRPSFSKSYIYEIVEFLIKLIHFIIHKAILALL